MSIFQIYWSVFSIIIIIGIILIIMGVRQEKESLFLSGIIITAIVGFLGLGLASVAEVNNHCSEITPSRLVKGNNDNVIVYLPDGSWEETHVEAIFHLPDSEICVERRQYQNFFTEINVTHKIIRCKETHDDGF